MKKFREYNQGQQYLIPPSESELIGETDLVKVVNRVVDSLNLKDLERKFSGGGCPSYHPVMMLKVLIYSYSQKVYSSREIAKRLKRDLHFMWLSGRQNPDFRTINRFRGEYFKTHLPKVFAEVTLLLLEKGYVKGSEFFVDGTTLEADANQHKMVWKKNTQRYKKNIQDKISKILEEVEELNKEEDEYYDGEDLPEYGKPGAITAEDIEETARRINDKISKKTSRDLKKMGEKLKEYEKQEETLGERNSYSKTDPEATAMKMKDKSIKPAYNIQVSAENGFAVGYSLHQKGNDTKAFNSHLDSLVTLPKRFVGDSAYGSEENYKALESKGIESYLKYQSFHAEQKGRLHPFAKENFTYDESRDVYQCPKGKDLVHKSTKVEGPKVLKSYQATGCSFCSAHTLCCFSRSSRTVQRSDELERLKSISRENLTSPLGIELRKRRGNECESIYGVMKHVKSYTRVRLRGLAKATTELGLVLLGINISKMALIDAKATG